MWDIEKGTLWGRSLKAIKPLDRRCAGSLLENSQILFTSGFCLQQSAHYCFPTLALPLFFKSKPGEKRTFVTNKRFSTKKPPLFRLDFSSLELSLPTHYSFFPTPSFNGWSQKKKKKSKITIRELQGKRSIEYFSIELHTQKFPTTSFITFLPLYEKLGGSREPFVYKEQCFCFYKKKTFFTKNRILFFYFKSV